MKQLLLPIGLLLVGLVLVYFLSQSPERNPALQNLELIVPVEGTADELMPFPQTEIVQPSGHFSGQEDGLEHVQDSAIISPETLNQSDF